MKSITQITLSGLRGGAGTTSLAAMLADSLRLLGESVLVVDLNPDDLLRLHFNIPYGDINGWAFAQQQGNDWQQHTYQIDPNLWVLPYGRHGLAGLGVAPHAVDGEALWAADVAVELAQSSNAPAWLIFDLPAAIASYAHLRQSSKMHLLVSQPDMASHILLGQYPLTQYPNTKIMINGLDPAQRVNEAVVLDWDVRYKKQLAPIRFYQDAHVPEALAHKMPASSYFPESAAAQDMLSLATWCLTQRGEAR